MKDRLIMMVAGLALVFTSSSAWAMPEFSASTLDTPGTHQVLTLPAATDNSPVISLGTAIDPQTGKTVSGYAIVHYAKGGGGRGGGGSTGCYAFMASGAKWKTIEPWVMNPANASGLDGSTVVTNQSANIDKWEDAGDGAIGGGSVNILGSGTETGDTLVADTTSPDGSNEVYFADISESGAIGVTIVWGIFSGPPKSRVLVEWDQIYNDFDYTWSLSGEAGEMDFENISTHELGHSVGLADLYNSACSTQTMYGYADFGETNKRTLESGDIAGVSSLY